MGIITEFINLLYLEAMSSTSLRECSDGEQKRFR